MTYEEFAIELPRERRITFSSAEENEETMRRHGVDQRVRQLGRGPFRSDMAVRSTEEAEFFCDRFNRACAMQFGPPAGMIGLAFFRREGGPLLVSGEEVDQDKLVFLPGGVGADLVTPELVGSDCIGIPQARFAEMSDVLSPTRLPIPPDRVSVIEGNTSELLALRRALVEIVAADVDPGSEQVSNLLARLVGWLGESRSLRTPEQSVVNGARQHVAKKARDYIDEYSARAIRIEDLCRATGVGTRTLQRCFREYFDLTISEYLKSVRLHTAHRELVASEPDVSSVTDIAMRHGFTHLGRFSGEFHDRFGTHPSKALAMPAGRSRSTQRNGATCDYR